MCLGRLLLLLLHLWRCPLLCGAQLDLERLPASVPTGRGRSEERYRAPGTSPELKPEDGRLWGVDLAAIEADLVACVSVAGFSVAGVAAVGIAADPLLRPAVV